MSTPDTSPVGSPRRTGSSSSPPLSRPEPTSTLVAPGARSQSWLLGEPGLTPHELRHTAAWLAISAGANVTAVQRMLSHASAAMTVDRYVDLFDDNLDAVADRLDAVRDAARGPAADSVRTNGQLINLA